MIYFGGVGKGRSEDVTFKLRPEVGVEMSVIQFVGGGRRGGKVREIRLQEVALEVSSGW